ncbi:MAG: ABC-2 family transporter protein [Oscillospiraceae bacterium]|nr:ABC-2 family transporter protein [Oscillospiraceae bacterium]
MAYSFRLYSMIVSKEARRFFTYRANILAGCLTAFFTLAARYALWSALFATGNAQGSSFTETMTYFVLYDILMIWAESRYNSMIGADIRSGDIVQKLTKPCPYHLQLVAAFHATSLTSTLTRALPMLAAALAFIGLLPPVSVTALFAFILAAVLGMVIYSLVDFIVSYTAFWLTDYWYLGWLMVAIFLLFGGIALPLWFYPDWLRVICDYLPFQYAVFKPVAIYLGRVAAGEIAFTIAMQLFWIAVLFVIERLVWRLAQRKLTVQGG